ncbi:MAG: preprotein translocase subunit SecG [Alphaproteobacteria bacterium]|nr:preprotein translocase subunit SecG [Alphaproteobacteria bacterium]
MLLQTLLIFHVLIAIVLIVLILFQKSEGGAGGAGFSVTAAVNSAMQPRPRPNPLSRATTILGFCFFATSLGLALLARPTQQAPSLFDAPSQAGSTAVPTLDPAIPVVPGPGAGDSTPPAPPAAPNN